MSGRVAYTVTDGVGRIVLDRPEKLNAITPAMAQELFRVCREVDRDDRVRAALVAGAGDKAFSAGSDLEALADLGDGWAFRNRVEYAAAVRDVRKPVVAALRGWVLGGGLEIALAADIRIAGRSARLGAPEVTRGWVGGGGASQMLPRLVGYGQAMKLCSAASPSGCGNSAPPRARRGAGGRRRCGAARGRDRRQDRLAQPGRDAGREGRGSRRAVDAARGGAPLRERAALGLYAVEGKAEGIAAFRERKGRGE